MDGDAWKPNEIDKGNAVVANKELISNFSIETAKRKFK